MLIEILILAYHNPQITGQYNPTPKKIKQPGWWCHTQHPPPLQTSSRNKSPNPNPKAANGSHRIRFRGLDPYFSLRKFTIWKNKKTTQVHIMVYDSYTTNNQPRTTSTKIIAFSSHGMAPVTPLNSKVRQRRRTHDGHPCDVPSPRHLPPRGLLDPSVAVAWSRTPRLPNDPTVGGRDSPEKKYTHQPKKKGEVVKVPSSEN